MQASFTALLPILTLALSVLPTSTSAHNGGIYDPYRYAQPIPSTYGSSVTYHQTKSKHISSKKGQLNSALSGIFPFASDKLINFQSDAYWAPNVIGGGISGGDGKTTRVGNGVEWENDKLVNFVGVKHAGKSFDLRLTIANDGEVEFEVNGKKVDLEKIVGNQAEEREGE